MATMADMQKAKAILREIELNGFESEPASDQKADSAPTDPHEEAQLLLTQFATAVENMASGFDNSANMHCGRAKDLRAQATEAEAQAQACDEAAEALRNFFIAGRDKMQDRDSRAPTEDGLAILRQFAKRDD